MKKFKIAAVVTTAALALAACSNSADTDKDTDKTTGSDTTASATDSATTDAPSGASGVDYNPQPRENLKDGGTITMATTEITAQANPFHQDGTLYTSQQFYWYNPQIALFDDEGTYVPNPDYLTKVEAKEVDGNTVVTFDIREEAVYNDGTPIDYTAFVNTWKSNNGTDEAYMPSSTDGYSKMKSVERGTSDKQAVVTYDGTYAWWQGQFNMLLHPKVDTAEKFNTMYLKAYQPDLGAGPFKVESVDFEKGEATFVPNEKWWGDKPKLEKFTYRQMESAASLNAFLNGEIDATGVGNLERYTAVKNMDGITIRTGFRPSNYILTLNGASDNLKDIKVREAIFTAVDRKVIADIQFQGLNYTENAPGSFVLFESQAGYEDNFGAVVKFDAEKSKALLEEAGWVAGADGIREKDGAKLSVRYVLLGDDATTKAVALAYQKMLKDVGVDMQIQEKPSSEFSNVYTTKDFDIFSLGFSSSDPFGVAYFGQIYRSDSGLNLSGTGTADFDKKIDELEKLATADEQIAKANELEKEAFALYGIMPTHNGPDMIAVKNGLSGVGSMGFAIVPKEDIGWEK